MGPHLQNHHVNRHHQSSHHQSSRHNKTHQQPSNWGYHYGELDERHVLGPNDWNDAFSVGKRQSPIDICIPTTTASLTCCHGRPTSVHHEHQTSGKTSGHRRHLDSVGEERPRSSSSCSSTVGSPHSVPTPSDSGTSSPVEVQMGRLSHQDIDEDDAQLLQQQDNDGWLLHHRRSPYKPDKGHLTNRNSNKNTNKLDNGQELSTCLSKHKVFLGYPRYMHSVPLTNTGHNWQVDIPKEIALNTLMIAPPFGHREYKLAQFHCHWGTDCAHGSEHTINGRHYAAEIHFVHWNCTDYATLEEAASSRHGLAVLGVLVDALPGESNRNKHLDKICDAIELIKSPKASTQLQSRLDPKKLFPANRWNYATYEGSLTTPPLSEVVDWLVFLEPIQCSESQVHQFRRLECQSGHRLLGNCRPTQPLNGRQVNLWSHH